MLRCSNSITPIASPVGIKQLPFCRKASHAAHIQALCNLSENMGVSESRAQREGLGWLANGHTQNGPEEKGHKEEEAAGEGGDAGPSALSDAGAPLDAGGEGGGAHETAAHGAQPVHHERSGLAREVPALEEPCGREEAGPCWYVGAGSSIFETGVKRAKSL